MMENFIQPAGLKTLLNREGWSPAAPIPGDVSPRRYYRVQKGQATAIVMECSREDTNRPGLKEFLGIGAWLRGAGIRTPEIYAADLHEKWALIEDFGSVSFKEALEGGTDEARLYGLAMDVLDVLRGLTPPADLNLRSYHATHVHDLRRDIIDTWLPAVRGTDNPPGLTEDFLACWEIIETALPPVDTAFLHMDYHLENMMWLPGEKGVTRCGLIDFQDACLGPAPYDGVNILENVRCDVPADVVQEYLAGQDDVFLLWHRVLAAQWHGRVLGLFTRLAQEGRPQYLVHRPRIYRYMAHSLKDPVLKPLKVFFANLNIDFEELAG